MDRRDLLLGAACVATAGAAYGLIPRRRESLLGAKSLDQIIPRRFNDWTSRDVSDLVAPKEEDSLAARLYGATVGRVYRQDSTGAEVMMLLAHGDTQSDDLQLHRPEICYPAFGFALSGDHTVEVPLAPRVSIPARQLVADAAERRESILYWTRLGEFLPTSRKRQQLDRLRTAMTGVVADGLLARFSVAGVDAIEPFKVLGTFAPALVRAVLPGDRAVLVGQTRAAAMSELRA
jgi:EpsI family protein